MPRINRDLVNARLQLGLSQNDMARQLPAGRGSIARWEQGVRPSPYYRKLLCDFFGKTEAELGLAGLPEEEHASSLRLMLSLPPQQTTPLVGREADLLHLRARLVAGGAHCVVGLPGVGKTTLALALAYDPAVRSHFGEHILWCSLGHHPDLDDLLASWGKVFGFSVQKMAQLSRAKMVGALREAIGEERLCIILDDVWDIADVSVFLQVGGSNASVLLTSRFPRVGAGLVGAEFFTLAELNEDQGLQLLRHFSPRTVELEEEKAKELVRTVGGLPLALTLIGRYLVLMAWSGKPRRIQTALAHLLETNECLTLPVSPVDQTATLQSVIALSEQLLEASTREALQCLALFPPKPGTFSEAAALAVADTPVETLDFLEDLGLIEAVGERYRIHRTIADYCQYQMSSAHLAQARERLVAYFLQALEEHQQDAPWLLEESQGIECALDAAHALQKGVALIRMTFLFTPFLLAQGRLMLAQNHLQRAIDAARELPDPPVELPRLLLYLGETYLKRGHQNPLAIFQEAIALAVQKGDQAFASEILGSLAWHSHLYGEYDQADIFLKEGLALATSLNLVNQLWTLYRVAGSQYWARGNYQAAEHSYRLGLQLYDQVDTQVRWLRSLYECFLGVFEGERGHYPQAESLFSRSIQTVESYGFKDFAAFVLARRAMMRLMYNPSDELREELLGALLIASEANGFAIYVHKALAQLELFRGNVDQAESHALTGLKLVEAFETQNRRAEHRTILAQIALARGEYEKGRREMEETLPLIRRYGAAEDRAIALTTAAELALAVKDLESAEDFVEELFETAPIEFLAIQAIGHYCLARLAAARNQWTNARREGEKSLQMFRQLGHVRAREVEVWLDTLRLSLVPPAVGNQKEKASKESA